MVIGLLKQVSAYCYCPARFGSCPTTRTKLSRLHVRFHIGSAMDAPERKRKHNPENCVCVAPSEISLSEFQKHVKSSQLRKFNFDYFIHGLVEEAGEVVEAVQKKRSEQRCSDVASELGDVLWYVAALNVELGGGQLADSWPQACIGRLVEHEAPEPVSGSAVDLLLIASKLAGRTKKTLRGDKTLDEFLPDMRMYMCKILNCCAQVAASHGLCLQHCAQMNVCKLEGRKSRGTVLGDGNCR